VEDFIRDIGGIGIDNLADYGVLADTIEVIGAILMILGGIFITHRIQVWADRAGEHPGAVNRGEGGGYERYEQRSMRN
jgi:hypothetical protein